MTLPRFEDTLKLFIPSWFNNWGKTIYKSEGHTAVINYARERAIKMMENSKSAIIATTGPSGLQIGEFPCQSQELTIYFLIPRTSDHLYNLEQNGQVALHTDKWELTGHGEILPEAKKWPNISLVTQGYAMWYVMVKVIPSKIHVLQYGEWGPSETIDLSSFI